MGVNKMKLTDSENTQMESEVRGKFLVIRRQGGGYVSEINDDGSVVECDHLWQAIKIFEGDPILQEMTMLDWLEYEVLVFRYDSGGIASKMIRNAVGKVAPYLPDFKRFRYPEQ